VQETLGERVEGGSLISGRKLKVDRKISDHVTSKGRDKNGGMVIRLLVKTKGCN